MAEFVIENATKLFFDTEFTGLHKNTTLISLGITNMDNDCVFYAEFTDYDKTQVDDWIIGNVIEKLNYNDSTDFVSRYYTEEQINVLKECKEEHILSSPKVYMKGTTEDIRNELRLWLSQFEKVELWSDCLSYDFVLFVDIFGGTAFDLPENVYYIPFDICTKFKDNNIDPDIKREEYAESLDLHKKHNALFDAEIISLCYKKLENII